MTTQLKHPYIAPKVSLLPGTPAVLSALELADYAHANQTRREYGLQEPVPYIAHPLRNAHLVWLWTNEHLHDTRVTELVAASLLHDTVEDEPERIQAFYGSDREPLALIRANFGPRVSEAVRRVTFLSSLGECGTFDRNVTYLDHIAAEVVSDEDAFLTKAVDLVDNAGSLWHSPLPERRVRNLALKYTAPVELMLENAGVVADHRVRSAAVSRLERLSSSLRELVGA